LFSILDLAEPAAARRSRLQVRIAEKAEIILFDILEEGQLLSIGELLEGLAGPGRPVFSVGSSSIESALASVWVAQGRLDPPHSWPNPGPAEPLLIASGSCSPVTE